MSSPGDIPPLRVLYNAPVLRALPTTHVDGIAVDFEGFSFFVYLSGEEETATRFTLTPEVPGALELVVTRCHAGGADITVMPRVATAVLAAVGATPYFLHGHPPPYNVYTLRTVHMPAGRPRGCQWHAPQLGFQPLSPSSEDEDEQPQQQLPLPHRRSIKVTLRKKRRL